MENLFAVIDVETTWSDEVMSIGLVIADYNDYSIKEKIYYIIGPQYLHGGMFFNELLNTRGTEHIILAKKDATTRIRKLLDKLNVTHIFAYNAKFDYRHLQELSKFTWIDIMRVAAYRQYNDKLPRFADYCGTGRLKTGYGVEPMYKILSGLTYIEEHNAICDAEDELDIMRMLDKEFEDYKVAKIN